MRKKLPIGIQTFREICQEDYYYVDKTPLALKLVSEGKYYFLSRPRRFGKSLFLDTLKELFEGNRSLFTGLYAEQHWDWSIQYPVLRLSFGGGVLSSPTDLHAGLHSQLTHLEEQFGLIPQFPDPRSRFADLIKHCAKSTQQRVVVLVDEYDKPILDNLTKPEVAQQMRDGLRDLYSVIKDNDAHIRFAFLTGVSKFSKVSIFSGLNNLRDITLSKEYSAICGYTDEDVDTVFAPELEGLDREEIRAWYNGYNWTGTAVYNPFDVLLLFKERVFRPYWFETGTPTFLIDVLAKRQTFTPDLQQMMAFESLLSSFDVERMATEALLWQTGYLTIADQLQIGARTEYTLTYPNLEVQASLNDSLLQRLCGDLSHPGRHTGQLYRLLLAHDLPALQQHLHSLLAGIPHDWYRNNPITQYEGYWASIFYSHFAALGLDIRLEDVTNHGRIDMTVLFNGHIYIFEFKVVEQVPEGKALAQLQAKNYADKYRSRGEPIHLIGVEFSKDSRNIVGFETAHG